MNEYLKRAASFSRSQRKMCKRRAVARRPIIEPMEARTLLSAGQLDTTFGTGGSVLIPTLAYGSAVAAQPNGLIDLLINPISAFPNTATQVVVKRLEPDGSSDTTFGTMGAATIPAVSPSQTESLLIQPNGDILVVSGETLARLTPAGALDTSFAGGIGYETLPASATGAALQSDGKILILAGTSVYRFNTDGSSDTSYGVDGIAALTAPGLTNPQSGGIAIDSAGRAVVSLGGTGMTSNTLGEFELERLTTSGALDTTFGVGGITNDGGQPDDAGTSTIAIAPDGTIYLASNYDQFEADDQSIISRFSSSGTLLGGSFQGSSADGIFSLTVQPDNKLLAGGYVFAGSGGDNTNVAVERFLPDSLTPDTAFNGSGSQQVDYSTGTDNRDLNMDGYGDYGWSVALQPDGGILVAGSTNNVDAQSVMTNEYTLSRLTNDITLIPTASVAANPPAADTSSAFYDFTVTYSGLDPIDTATLGNENLTVTFPDGVTTQAARLVSMNLANATTVHVTYSISFASNLSVGDQGAYQVAVNANSVTTTEEIPVPAGSIGSFNLTVVDNTPPTVSVNTSQQPGSTRSNLYDFTVTYADNVAVNASTISSNNLIVTFPDNTTQDATLVSTNLSNGPTVAAVYRLAFPADLSTALNGTAYQVSMNGNSVKDTSGNAVAAGAIGSFTLTVDASQLPPGPTGDFTVSSPAGKILTAVVAGVTRQGPLAVTVTNNGAGPITGTVTVTLYLSGSSIHDSSSTVISDVLHKVKNLKVGKSFVVHFKPFKFPSTPGTDYIVADAALGTPPTLDRTDAASPTITVAAPFVHGVPIKVLTTKQTLVTGRKYTAYFIVKNTGNIAYNGPATVGVAVQPTAGTATSIVTSAVPIMMHLQPGKSGKFKVAFVATNLPSPGSDYALVLTINIPGDASATALSSTKLLTI